MILNDLQVHDGHDLLSTQSAYKDVSLKRQSFSHSCLLAQKALIQQGFHRLETRCVCSSEETVVKSTYKLNDDDDGVHSYEQASVKSTYRLNDVAIPRCRDT